MIDRLGFGAASIGNLYRAVDDAQAREVLQAAWDAGIRYYDTAPHYGLGLSERRLGAFLREQPRDAFRLSTKVGRVLEPDPSYDGVATDEADGFVVPATMRRRWDPSEAGIVRSLDESRERLGIERIDTVFLHDPDVYGLDDGLRRGLPALVGMRERGEVGEIGVGVNSVDAALRAVVEHDVDVVMIAGRYTLLEQPAAAALLPACLERGVRVVAAAVFNSGLLAVDRPADAHYDYGDVPADVAARTEALRAICDGHGVPLPTAALQYPLRHPAVDVVAVGSARASSVRANAAAIAAPIPAALWRDLAAAGLAD